MLQLVAPDQTIILETLNQWRNRGSKFHWLSWLNCVRNVVLHQVIWVQDRSSNLWFLLWSLIYSNNKTKVKKHFNYSLSITQVSFALSNKHLLLFQSSNLVQTKLFLLKKSNTFQNSCSLKSINSHSWFIPTNLTHLKLLLKTKQKLSKLKTNCWNCFKTKSTMMQV